MFKENQLLSSPAIWTPHHERDLVAVADQPIAVQKEAIQRIAQSDPRLNPAQVTDHLVDFILKQARNVRLHQRELLIQRILELKPAYTRQDVVKRLNALALKSLPEWANSQFWIRHIDPILLGGIELGRQQVEDAVVKIRNLYPSVSAEAIHAHYRLYRWVDNRRPDRSVEDDWSIEAENILRDAISSEKDLLKAAIQRASREHKEIRHQAIHARLHMLRRARERGRIERKAEAHHIQRQWTGADLHYLVYHVGNESVVKIARALKRTTKSVLRKIEDLGLSAALSTHALGVFSLRELRQQLHVRHATILRWIEEGELQVSLAKRKPKRGCAQHVKIADLIRFLQRNQNRLNLLAIDPESDVGMLLGEIAATPENAPPVRDSDVAFSDPQPNLARAHKAARS